MSPFRRLRGEEPPTGLPEVRIDPATGEPEPFWRYALRSLGGVAGRLVVGRLHLLFALPWLVFGGIFLSGAWEMGAGAVGERERRAELTGRGEAVVEASWWRIDFDPSPLGDDGTNWRGLARRELCSRFRFVSAEGGPTAVACRRFQGLADGRELLVDGDPELPVRWVDSTGRPALDLRLSPRADGWLRARPAMWWPLVPQDDAMRARHRPGSELDALLIEADAPAELLLAAWDPAAAAPLAMAFDPERPERAVPLAALAPRRAPPGEPPLLPIFAVAGLLLWSIGCTVLTAGARRWVRAAVLVGTLLLLPWWGSHLHRALGLVWEPAGGLAVFLGPELAPVWRRAAPRPDGDEASAGDVRLPLTFATSRYADVLALAADLPLPSPGASPDEVLTAVSEAIAERALALPDDELARWAAAADAHARLAAHGADLLIVEALTRLSLDPARPEVAWRASYALSYVAHRLRPLPEQRAYATRGRLLQALREHPEPIVFNMANLE